MDGAARRSILRPLTASPLLKGREDDAKGGIQEAPSGIQAPIDLALDAGLVVVQDPAGSRFQVAAIFKELLSAVAARYVFPAAIIFLAVNVLAVGRLIAQGVIGHAVRVAIREVLLSVGGLASRGNLIERRDHLYFTARNASGRRCRRCGCRRNAGFRAGRRALGRRDYVSGGGGLICRRLPAIRIPR